MKIKRQAGTILLLAGIACLWGCTITPKYDILVNGYLDRDKGFDPGTAFFVLQNEKAQNTLFEKELADKVDEMLVRAGYRVTPLEQADFCIRLFYGTSSGTQLQTEYFEDPFMPYYYGYPYWPGYCWGFHGPPRIVNRVSMLYHHGLNLQVIEAEPFRKDGSDKVAWVGEASYTTSLPDLRTAMHFMLKALFRYFGDDTQIGRIVTLKPTAQSESGSE